MRDEVFSLKEIVPGNPFPPSVVSNGERTSGVFVD